MTATASIDHALQQSVRDELEWIPEVDAASVGVTADDGVVTLHGEVASAAERRSAVRAAQRVRGVRTLLDELTVRPRTPTAWPSEAELGRAVDSALAWDAVLPRDAVHAVIHDHDVVLTGRVEWNYQREGAFRAVQKLRGVRSVSNRIEIAPKPMATDTERRIRTALIRNASIDADRITVMVQGTEVTISGRVRSWAERTQAENAAWSSPAVTRVHNELVLVPE